jgi:hypothetical protein
MAMTLVSTVTVGSVATSSIQFSNIAQTGKDLFILVSARRTDNGAIVSLVANSDTGTNYRPWRLRGTGSAASTDDFGNETYSLHYGANNSVYTANSFGNGGIYISNYTSSSAKIMSSEGVGGNNATSNELALWANRWSGTAAITSITLGTYGGGDFVQNTTASLYIIS